MFQRGCGGRFVGGGGLGWVVLGVFQRKHRGCGNRGVSKKAWCQPKAPRFDRVGPLLQVVLGVFQRKHWGCGNRGHGPLLQVAKRIIEVPVGAVEKSRIYFFSPEASVQSIPPVGARPSARFPQRSDLSAKNKSGAFSLRMNPAPFPRALYPGASTERGRHLLPQSHNFRFDFGWRRAAE